MGVAIIGLVNLNFLAQLWLVGRQSLWCQTCYEGSYAKFGCDGKWFYIFISSLMIHLFFCFAFYNFQIQVKYLKLLFYLFHFTLACLFLIVVLNYRLGNSTGLSRERQANVKWKWKFFSYHFQSKSLLVLSFNISALDAVLQL